MSGSINPASAVPWSEQLLAFCDRYRYWLFAIILAVYLAAFNGQWRMEPDSALYLSIGRNLAQGKGFTYQGKPNDLAYPGWPWLIAATFKIVGGDSLPAVLVVLLLIALATIALTYRLFLLHSGRPTAVIVAVGLGMTKSFFVYGFELWSDMLFVMGVMAFLAGYKGVSRADRSRVRWFDWAFLLAGLVIAVATRPTMWALLIAIVLTLLWRAIRAKRKAPIPMEIIALVILIIAAAFALDPRYGPQRWGGQHEQYVISRVTSNPGDMLRDAVSKNARQLLSLSASDVLFQVRFGAFNGVLSLLVLALGIGLFAQDVLWGFWFSLVLVMVMLVLPLDRYFLPVLPLLVYQWWRLMTFANRMLPRYLGNLVFLLLLGFGTGMNGSKIGGVIMQQRTKPFLEHFDRGTFAVVPEFANQLRQQTPENALVLVGSPYARVISFLSRRTVTGVAWIDKSELRQNPVYVIEPASQETLDQIKESGLVEGREIFTVHPSPAAGPDAHALTLRGTHPFLP